MPTLQRPDGVEIYWEEHGSGPLVVLGSYWSMHPSVYANLLAELEPDHRIVLYHDRGTGSSTRQGPYDLETSAADLGAVIDAAGGGAVVICTAEASNRAVRVAAEQPDLIVGIVAVGGAPVGRSVFSDSDVMAASDVVVEALLSQVETDFRGALRSLVTATNPQMSEEELRERVNDLIDHCPHEVAVARLRAWAEDDPTEYSRAAGDRLWVAISDRLGGGWFPTGEELERRVRKVLPDARFEWIEDGFVSRPDQTAAIARKARAAHGALEHAE